MVHFLGFTIFVVIIWLFLVFISCLAIYIGNESSETWDKKAAVTSIAFFSMLMAGYWLIHSMLDFL